MMAKYLYTWFTSTLQLTSFFDFDTELSQWFSSMALCTQFHIELMVIGTTVVIESLTTYFQYRPTQREPRDTVG